VIIFKGKKAIREYNYCKIRKQKCGSELHGLIAWIYNETVNLDLI
jgi:hypothetical protein